MPASHRPADRRARSRREAEVGQELGPSCVLIYPETMRISRVSVHLVRARSRARLYASRQ